MKKQQTIETRLKAAQMAVAGLKTVQQLDYSSVVSKKTMSGSLNDWSTTVAGSSGHHRYTLTVTPVHGRPSACNLSLWYSINQPDVLTYAVTNPQTGPAVAVYLTPLPPATNGAMSWSMDVYHNPNDSTGYTCYVKLLIEGTDDFTWTIT